MNDYFATTIKWSSWSIHIISFRWWYKNMKFNFTDINQCFAHMPGDGYGRNNLYLLIKVAHPSKWCMGDHCTYSLLSDFDCINRWTNTQTRTEYAVTLRQRNRDESLPGRRRCNLRNPPGTYLNSRLVKYRFPVTCILNFSEHGGCLLYTLDSA